MLSYSRSRGAFAGISLEGSTVRPDNDANKRIYGKTISAEDIITESRLHAPASAAKLIARLQKASPHLKP
jgi:lipid-binding SYLF domain-containing protein